MSLNLQPQLLPPTFEQHHSGIGVDTSTPRISWKPEFTGSDLRNWVQEAYELEISRSSGNDGVTSSSEIFRVESSQSVLVPWPTTPLKSRERVAVRVRVFNDKGGNPDATWSPWAVVEAALLSKDDWTATLVTTAAESVENGPLRPLRFRKKFSIQKEKGKISSARLYVTSHGVYEIYINGRRVGDHFMAPGWTSYNHRLNYQIFDVADLLHEGQNLIAAEVAEGWYATRLAWEAGRRFVYGKELAILSQLEISFRDPGSTQIVISDDTWKSTPSAITLSELYDGEKYDLREEQAGWNISSELDTTQWKGTRVLPFPTSKLVSPDAPPVRIIESLEPIEIFTSPSGKTILDFGQNLVGVLKIHSLLKPNGHAVTLRHAEVLEDSELSIRPLRTAKATDVITFDGTGELKDWTPKHTFHGFRYAQIEGWSINDSQYPLTKSSVTALVIHSDIRRTGYFACSEPLVNRLHENAVWSMKGNFLSIPTDCPQRDERLGWTGDIQVFAPSAAFLYNVNGMLGNWLEDVALEQEDDHGIPPVVVPNVLQSIWPCTPQAVWDDVVILVPWAIYEASGDAMILSRQFDSMKSWLDVGIRRGEDRLWDENLWQLGDWLDPAAPPDNPGLSRTDGTLVADAYLVHVTEIFSRVCSIIGKTEDYKKYSQDFAHVKEQFQQKYITPSGLLASDTQTALSLALDFKLHSSSTQRSTAATRLVKLVRYNLFKSGCGFAGTPVVTHALSATGHEQIAYRMLLEKHCPSWLYPVTMGATTVWERWDSLTPDGKVNKGQMTSFNHYALGSIVAWLHEVVGGLKPLEVGWKKFKIAPLPGGSLTSASVTYDSPYGYISSKWELQGEDFRLSIHVPPNTTAIVLLPGKSSELEDGGEIEVGSGHHNFTSTFLPKEKWPPRALLTEYRVDDGSGFV